ncbi:MAG: DNA/RNA nuclease SfsA [Alphaproteobacteria bacterium]|nr:DNA/RNA nuclease SfsA [Alphaproteobacteria bacterium]
MQITDNLEIAEVVGKYNRLIIDVKLNDKSIVSAFCSCYDVAEMCHPGTMVYIGKRKNKNLHLEYEIEFIVQDNKLVYAQPNHNNDLFAEAFDNGSIPEFSDYNRYHRIGASDKLAHIDFELSNSRGEKCFVFITNIYKKIGADVFFPSEINFFELEMFEEMEQLRMQGHKTCIFMIVPRSDCHSIHFSWKLSPLAAGKIFEEAKNGLNFIGYGCNINKMSVTLSNNIPVLY